MTSQQAASLMASGVVGFLIATYIMHNGMNSRVSLDDARSLAQKNWTSSKLDGSIVQSIRPFNVSFSYFMVSDLLNRLALAGKYERARIVEDTEEESYSDHELTNDVIEYWVHRYDFKRREEHLNRHPQFIVNVQGLDIHYYHVRPKNSSASTPWPLLILHGWPSSAAEFLNLVTELTSRSSGPEVIVPSLPGFGFSGYPKYEGLGPVGIAHLMRHLVNRLGHQKFVVQGNDLGAEIAANMAVLYPDEVMGLHSTMCRATPTSHWVSIKATILNKIPWLILDSEERGLVSSLKNVLRLLYKDDGHIYLREQQALASDILRRTLKDSPAALAAQLLHNYPIRANNNNNNNKKNATTCGKVHDDIDFDLIIDNIMYYWVPSNIESSLRLFRETENDRKYSLERIPIRVPSVCMGLNSSQNRMPATLLRNRFLELQRYSTNGNASSVLSSATFSKLLANDIAKSLDQYYHYHNRRLQ